MVIASAQTCRMYAREAASSARMWVSAFWRLRKDLISSMLLALAVASISAISIIQCPYIKRELIDPDPNNFYSLTGIEELAANIQLCGLQQPILVRPIDGGRYMVVSGHRRRAAIELLAEDEPEKWEEISCLVERDEASPELQQLRLIYANANTRTMTGAELAE